jgi:hypothetical protein
MRKSISMERSTVKKFLALLIPLLCAAAINVSGQQVKSGLADNDSSGIGAKTEKKVPDGKTGDSSHATIHLLDGKGTLKVFSEPVGAEIIIDGRTMGVTPLKIVNVDTGEHRMALRLQGHAAVEQGVRIAANETQKLSIALKPGEPQIAEKPPSPMPCTLAVATVPPGATLFINNQPSGTTPFRSETLAAGSYRVRLELTEYEPMEGTVVLKPGESHAVEKKMASAFGSLSVSTTPAGAAVVLNDRPSGTTPFREDKLRKGVYGLRLELSGYEAIPAGNITIKDSAVNLQYTLSRSKAWLDSVAAFKPTKHSHGRWARRIVFGLLAAGCGGVGAYFNQAADNAYKDYSALNKTSDFDAQWEKVETNRKTRDILYWVGGGFALAFVISIPF